MLRSKLNSLSVMAVILSICGVPVLAGHVPVALDVPNMWMPVPGAGYLDFMTPGMALPPSPIATEEHTGWTNAAGVGFTDPLGPPVWPAGPDNEPFAGDRADFDWVQEHRPDEVGATPGGSNHPGIVGYMGWQVAPTMASPHMTVGVGPHMHGGLPTLVLPDYGQQFFTGVDVFSQIIMGEGDVGGVREAALDYFVDFYNSTTGALSPGVPTIVWVPGWTMATTIDDYVARWVPSMPGLYDQVAIDPGVPNDGHDEITEIDAVVAIPEPGTLMLLALGAFVVPRRHRRSAVN